jgi:hypothetical protein
MPARETVEKQHPGNERAIAERQIANAFRLDTSNPA